MATSSVPTVKANLVTQLQARGGLANVQVTNGPPLPNPSREFIWVGTAEGTQAQAAMGGLRREEYGLEVVISVEREGTDIAAADARCFALVAELENQLRTDPTVNAAVEHAEMAGFRLGEFVGADGMRRVSELTATVDCGNWI